MGRLAGAGASFFRSFGAEDLAVAYPGLCALGCNLSPLRG